VDDEDREVCYVMRGGEGVKAGLCFLVEDFYPIMHGCTTQISMVGEQLVNVGMQVMVITRQIWQGQSCYEKLNGIEIVRVKPAVGVHRSGKYLMMVPAFVELVRKRRKYDVIIVCDLKALGILGVTVGKLLGKKCLLRAESCGEMDGAFATQFADPPSRLKLFLIKNLVRFRNSLLMRADGFLSISSVITKEFVNAGVSRNAVSEIPNAVDVRRFSPADKETKGLIKRRLGLSKGKHFVYTGRLARGKGLDYLLRVWKEIMRQSNDIHLIIVGSGQEHSLSCENEVRHFVTRNQLESTVRFTGNVNNVNEYLQASDYYILPSQSEGLSISLLEALACELPCITTNVGGTVDVIDNNFNGILIPYGDEDSLLKEMTNLLNDEEMAFRLGRQGRKTVVEKFNSDHICSEYLSTFTSVKSR